jgi:hypothetical protein
MKPVATQNVPVRNSPTFQPGQGFQLTPSATVATSPYATSSGSAGVTILAIDPFEIGTDTTGVSVSAAGQLIQSNGFAITLNLPQLVVPTGLFATLFPWVSLNTVIAGNTESGHFAVCAPLGAEFTTQAFYAGAWQSAVKIPPGIEVTAWQITTATLGPAAGAVYESINFTGTGAITLHASASGGALLVTYPA